MSFGRAQNTFEAVRKEKCLWSGICVAFSGWCQEFRFHGVRLAGPARELQKTGAKGQHRSNVRHDMPRKVGQIAPW